MPLIKKFCNELNAYLSRNNFISYSREKLITLKKSTKRAFIHEFKQKNNRNSNMPFECDTSMSTKRRKRQIRLYHHVL